ncbi:lysophospholipid acyltransferase family protein [Chitinophaga japonensis]|uniref:1-acyl-sn-glycerol-3-phosphate acyltransferase n=1 Tax=Chitinophaga japonensis TaxID=104662 RepID=A0A562SUD0_CHIJA|nr:lysophospholipid acyltransferase family protein [Chitinophaga japonensis]TWI84280.1 1-acyl-sn-glycerol-3-phosphate acyltransferase [Chitinophaga japonensis]
MIRLKNILARVYTVYGLSVFLITFLVMLLPMWIVSLLPEPRRTRWFFVLARGWMKVFMPLVFCPVRRKGLEYFEPGVNYIVVCNHNSLMDVPVTTPGVPGLNKTLAKIEMARIPLFGIMYRIGSVLVDRQDEQSRRNSYEQMKEVLAMGMHMILYPEGTRNKTGQPLKSFYDGAFSLAIDTQRPIMPAVLFHTRKILPPGRIFYALPHRIDFHFLPPIQTQGLGKDDMPALKERVFRIMWDYIEKVNG